MRLALALLFSTLILIVWGGVTQLFPWGPPSVAVVIAQSNPEPGNFHMTDPKIVSPENYTTPEFDNDLSGKLSMLFTDETVSWISSKPISYYDAPRYLIRQVFTQFLVAIFIISILSTLRGLAWRRQIGVVILAAVTASISTYGALWNWWGLSLPYAAGESFNLIFGWSIAALIGFYFLNNFGSDSRNLISRTVPHG